ncbi:hypothetical protein COCNU_12G000100 [Cocos nucifera]|uniref:Uncharacterized protein n=1 Tax=Cocos nucifera TaxID=13894 RepID=A0A8K0IQ69_COCNU|nr:hypothetical protein COCNU_12G000100 [Cocos nucifera]
MDRRRQSPARATAGSERRHRWITTAGRQCRCSRPAIAGVFPRAYSDTGSVLPGAENPLHRFSIAPTAGLGRNLGDNSPARLPRLDRGIDAGGALKGEIGTRKGEIMTRSPLLLPPPRPTLAARVPWPAFHQPSPSVWSPLLARVPRCHAPPPELTPPPSCDAPTERKTAMRPPDLRYLACEHHRQCRNSSARCDRPLDRRNQPPYARIGGQFAGLGLEA